jgi:dipeptidase E
VSGPVIVAMGGGGFSMEPRNPLLDLHVLSLARGRRPRICFLATASGDSPLYVARFHRAFGRLSCRPTHLPLFPPPAGDLRRILLRQDVIYVGGGQSRNMLLLWRAWGVDRALRAAWRGGTVLAGLSAGALCWFEEGLSDAVVPGRLAPLPCLGFLPGSFAPHYDGEPGRRPAYRSLVAAGRMRPGWGVDDGAALVFQGRNLAEVVASRRGARAWRVERVKGRAVETPVPARFLGDGASGRSRATRT